MANGRPQRGHITKEEVASPTVATESVMLTLVVDIRGYRDMCIFDIPNVFTQTTDGNKKVRMKSKGKLSKPITKTDPTLYANFVTVKNGKYVIHVELLKAIYGLIKSVILFYKKLVKGLKEIVFRLNPYDPCATKIIVNEKQHIIVWNVDDVKSSHVDTKVNDGFIH